ILCLVSNPTEHLCAFMRMASLKPLVAELRPSAVDERFAWKIPARLCRPTYRWALGGNRYLYCGHQTSDPVGAHCSFLSSITQCSNPSRLSTTMDSSHRRCRKSERKPARIASTSMRTNRILHLVEI